MINLNIYRVNYVIKTLLLWICACFIQILMLNDKELVIKHKMVISAAHFEKY